MRKQVSTSSSSWFNDSRHSVHSGCTSSSSKRRTSSSSLSSGKEKPLSSTRNLQTPSIPLRPSTLCFNSAVGPDNTTAPGGVGYRRMQESFSSSGGIAAGNADDSQATRLNTQEDDFVNFVNEVNQGKDDLCDGFSSEEESSVEGSGLVVEETQQFSQLPERPQLVARCSTVQSTNPPEWEDIPPDAVIKRLKAIPQEVLFSPRVREFYKSYPIWDKMSPEQKNKAVAWYRSLPEHIQGILLLISFRIYCYLQMLILFFVLFF
jgi:hypothetical protein